MIDAITSVDPTALTSHATSFMRNAARTISDSGKQKSAVTNSAFQNFGSDTGAPYTRRASP